MNETTGKRTDKYFDRRVWKAVGITVFVLVVLLIVYKIFNAFLLLLAASLIAIFFRALASKIQQWTGWKNGISLTLSIVGTFLLIGLFFWLMGSKVQSQASEMQEKVPEMIANAQNHLNQSEIGRKIVDYVSDTENQKKVLPVLQGFFSSTFGVFGDLYVVIFLALFLTIGASEYVRGMVKLVPRNGQGKAQEVVMHLGENLKKWIKGALFAGLIVFTLTAVGLISLGVGTWLVLAILAGFLNVIPNFGPIIAMIPAVLVGLMHSPTKALLIAGLFILVQTIESNLITPNVQKKLLNTPPALLLFFQVIMGALTGGWGIVLAVPLLVILMTLVKQLYYDKNNGYLESSALISTKKAE